MKLKLFILILVIFICRDAPAAENNLIVVAQDGTGDYKTITHAISALPMFNYGRVVIFIKDGIYNEKIRIEQDYVTLRGESREKTIIQFSQLREDWNKNPDHIGPAVINIHADDVILENMTIENTQPEIGPHAFAVYGMGTRTVILNCTIKSKGGDTVSLWNYKTGMYYHANCSFEGAVDFVCPRGWCFIKDSKFYEVKKTAALWHAGSYNKDQKLVIKNSIIDGVKDFELARHHYDAQFYFINCIFGAGMSDKSIYKVKYPNEPEKERAFNWGERYYFFNCRREGGSSEWIKNNFDSVVPIKPEEITASWTFGGEWDPESTKSPYVINYSQAGRHLIMEFNEPVTIINKPVIISADGKNFTFHSGGENSIVTFICQSDFKINEIENLKIIKGKIIASRASVVEREAVLDAHPKGSSKK